MSINSNSSKEESEEEQREQEREAYNKYIIEDGIHQKIQAMIEKEYQIKLWDRILTKTRQRIRAKGGMITHDAAMRLVIVQDGRKILEEILNEAIDELDKSYPLLAENLKSKDQKTREDAERILHIMIEDAENPN